MVGRLVVIVVEAGDGHHGSHSSSTLHRHQLGLAYQSLGEQERASECLQIALEHEVSSVPLTNMRGYEVLPRCV